MYSDDYIDREIDRLERAYERGLITEKQKDEAIDELIKMSQNDH